MVLHNALYAAELQSAAVAATKNSNYIRAAQSLPKIDFYTDVIKKLFLSDYNLTRHLTRLYKDGLIALDDYSVVANGWDSILEDYILNAFLTVL